LNARKSSRKQAIDRLGITLEQMEGVPRISHMLDAAERGIPQVIEALRGSSNADAVAFISRYDKLSNTDRNNLSIEEISIAAGVDTLQLLGVAVIALATQGQTVGEIIANTAHPEVVRKNVQMALSDAGVRDRDMFLQSRGFVPTPKGANVITRVQIANLSNPQAPTKEIEIEGDLPEMDEFIKEVHPIRVQNLLGERNG
jgi:hypothetical protein